MTEQDVREQLYNERQTGTIGQVQLPRERITTLHGILWDLDAKKLAPGNPFFPPADDLREFLQQIKPVLQRHPLARQAEIRISGSGLHAILWLRPAVELKSEAEQIYWDHVVRVIQRTLPADPNMPGMTALTRAVGSINSKNGAPVETLEAGEPVEPKAVEEFVGRLVKAPFKEVALILLGEERVHPCPVCRGEGTRLDVLDWAGRCYGRCGTVSGDQLFDRVYQPVGPTDSGSHSTQ
jgi:hypothetical protein